MNLKFTKILGFKNLFFVFTLFQFFVIQKNVNAQIIKSLTHRYCLDGDALDGVGTNNGIVYGAVSDTDRFGKPNSAMYFNGTSDYIDLPDDIWVSGDFSVSAWVKVDYSTGAGHWPRVFEFGNGIDQDNVFFTTSKGRSDYVTLGLHKCSSSLRTYHTPYSSGTLKSLPSSSTLISSHLPDWYHLVVTLKDDSVKIYINNSLVDASITSNPPCSVIRKLNYFARSNFPSDNYYHGSLDDIFIFDDAITDADVETLFKNQWCGSIIPKEDTTETPTDTTNTFIFEQTKSNNLGWVNCVPNPMIEKGYLTYKINKAAHYSQIKFFNTIGIEVKSIELDPKVSEGNLEFNRSNLPSGLYFYVLYVNGEATDRKKLLLD